MKIEISINYLPKNIQSFPAFVVYDIFRLMNYKVRKTRIIYSTHQKYAYLYFNDVAYFNYIFIFDSQIGITEIQDLLKIYNKNGVNRIKFITPKNINVLPNNWFEEKKEVKIIAELYLNQAITYTQSNENKLIKVVTDSELYDYTNIYLTTFNSLNVNYEDVFLNFKTLMIASEIDLYIIYQNNEKVGACSSFYNNNVCLLSACGVLEKFRNKGIHKDAIKQRIESANLKGFKEFRVIAYENSTSYHNLVKFGFSIKKIYEERISKHLENITI